MAYLLEPPPFRSLDEAYEFLANHEIATNNKYVSKSNKGGFSSAAFMHLPSFQNKRVNFKYVLETGSHDDGIPFVNMGSKTSLCQFGNRYKNEPLGRRTPGGFKKLREGKTKKVNCPATTKMTIVLKFPEYAVGSSKSQKLRKRMAARLRDEYTQDTQRYMLVFLSIYNNHDHGLEHILLNNLTHKEVSRSLLRNASIVTLKPGATLKGKNLSGLITQFAYSNELPQIPAQPCLNQPLDQMGINEMLALYCELTGDTPNSVFTAAQKDFTEENLRLLVHLCIVFSNAEAENSSSRMAHQSVRLSGTENSFSPVNCFDASCPVASAGTHMHCPFCSKAEGYTEVDVLKAHYYERHVAKAYEFGGLKFLRCRMECTSKSVYKDIKIYLQGHWHCWKCSKLFNKRSGFVRHIKNHANRLGSTKVLIDKNFYASANPQPMWHEVKPSATSTTVKMEPNTSHLDDEDEMEGYKNEPDYSFVHGTEDVLQPEYDRAVLYIQGENDQIVYTTEGQENAGDVVIHMSESETEHLHQRVRELEQKCLELEHENMAYKSHIEFLNKKVEDLTALNQQSVREKSSTPDDTLRMDIGGRTSNEEPVEPSTKTEPKKTTLVDPDDKHSMFVQSLEELRKHFTLNKKQEIPNDCVAVPSSSINDINEDLRQMKTDVEQLKMALVIGSQLKEAKASTIIQSAPVNPLIIGNYAVPTLYPQPQNVILNAANLMSMAAGNGSLIGATTIVTTGVQTTVAASAVTTVATSSKTTVVGGANSTVPAVAKTTVVGGTKTTVIAGLKNKIQQANADLGKVVPVGSGNTVGSGNAISPNMIKVNEKTGTHASDSDDDVDDTLDDEDAEMLDFDDAAEEEEDAESQTQEKDSPDVEKKDSKKTVDDKPASKPSTPVISKPNYVGTYCVKPTGVVLKNYHMLESMLNSKSAKDSTSVVNTRSKTVVTSQQQKDGKKTVVVSLSSPTKTEVKGSQHLVKTPQLKRKLTKPIASNQESKNSEINPDQTDVSESQNQTVKNSSKSASEKSQGKEYQIKTAKSLNDADTSSVVLAVVNDTISGGKKVVSLLQVSEDEAQLSIPFQYKCFQKEKKTKDDGTQIEVKKECVKNQIKLKVKGNVKNLQGDSLQRIVDSALSRFVVVNPPPNKKPKMDEK